MARQLSAIYELEGHLSCDTALSVAHGDSGMTDDIVCLRDGQGRLIIPGTSLAGVIRHHLGQNAQWGDDHDPADPRPPRPSQETWGSAVWVDDCVATTASVAVERRDGVAIDPETGAAETGALYSREVVPAATKFAVRIAVEQRANDNTQRAKELFEEIVRLLRAGVSVGGATSRGLGRITLRNKAQLRRRNLDSRSGMVKLLRGDAGEPVTVAGEPLSSRVSIDIPWRPTGPLLVKAASNGLADGIPLATSSQNQVRFVIPGASIKGVLRTRAERILRTLSRDPQNPDLRLVEVLFGTAPAKKARGNRGALTVLDCHTANAVGKWSQLLAAIEVTRTDDPKAQVLKARSRGKDSCVELLDHVAIDRWSGGSDDGRLFSLIAPLAPVEGDQPKGLRWEPIGIELDSTRFSRSGVSLEVALAFVALLLRDFADGEIPLGHGTTRGYGEVTAELDAISVKSTEIPSLTSVAALFAPPSGGSAQSVEHVQTQWDEFVRTLMPADPQEARGA